MLAAQQKQPNESAANFPADLNSGQPAEIWNAFFKSHKPRSAEVRRQILKLHDEKRHEHVIAAIEAAIINGQAQPWMYDVLALTMEIVGRPKEEIERVLLSRVDVTGTDVPSMLTSAAYLTRFGGHQQALKMYRQASRIAPTRPEPYVLGLKLARSQDDIEALKWAATGILTSAWTRNHQQLHRDAENAAAEAIQKMQQQGRIDEAAALRNAMREAAKRDLVLKLTWSGVGDLDLIVEEPSGTRCTTDNPQSPGGGVLVHDGYGPNQKNCYEEYVCAQGVPGKYRVRIRHIWGSIVGKRARLTVIRNQGAKEESVHSFIVPLAQEDRVVRLSLPHGRRKELAPVEDRSVSAIFEDTPRPRGILRQIGNPGTGGQAAGFNFANSRRFVGGVGFRPIVQTIPEGISMTAAAVVSGDRRYVRVSVNPQFSVVTDLFTFSFVNSGGNPTGNPGIGGGNGTP